MAAVSAELLEIIIELQRLSSLQKAVFGGGNNLVIRYDHRESIDIDLFFSGIIGKTGYKKFKRSS
jgi:UDP-N-acetylenolpyruvoylglucosamine reductase